MALNPRDVPFTREEIHRWVTGWYKAKNLGVVPPLRVWLRDKIMLELPARTQETDVLRQTEDQGLAPRAIVQTILDDLDSYIDRDKQNVS